MKRFLFLLISLCIVITTQAHFVAYQEWYNPKTGQVLEEFYDVHETTNLAIDWKRQQKEVIERAKKYKDNVLVLTEDAESIGIAPDKLNLMILQYNAWKNRLAPKGQTSMQVIVDSCPLNRSFIQCKLNKIEVLNIENRVFSPNKSRKTQFSECATLDNNAVLAINNSSNKHIILMAGVNHIRNINNILLGQGWIPSLLITPETLLEKRLVEDFYVQIIKQPLDDFYEKMSRENHALSINSPLFFDHAILVKDIPINPLLSSAPVFSEQRSKIAADQREIRNPKIEVCPPCLLQPSRFKKIWTWIKNNPKLTTAGIIAGMGTAWWASNTWSNRLQ